MIYCHYYYNKPVNIFECHLSNRGSFFGITREVCSPCVGDKIGMLMQTNEGKIKKSNENHS